MKVKMKIFGQLAEIIGSDRITVKDVEDTDRLIGHLKELHPRLGEIKFSIAVDKKIIEENTMLTGNSVVALLPPYSGG